MLSILISFFLLLFSTLFWPYSAFAFQTEAYVTVVNPMRGRTIWKDINALKNQIKTTEDKKIAVTWLIQYENLLDKEVLEVLKSLTNDQEIGLFLEIDNKLADDSFVPYLIGQGDWARADKVLLSGYNPSERQRMIDTAFHKFKETFGFYPATVGAWYIDAFSLNYMVKKFRIQANLTVSDQFQTDGYGLWGQPWGSPYYPSKMNPLIPAQTAKNKLGLVTIQWAQRDPVRGYGLTVADSTYSVQANDYTAHHKLDTDYFLSLARAYLEAPNEVNQLTVGLEVGQEGVKYSEELKRQIDSLISLRSEGKIEFVTVSEFAKRYKKHYPDLSPVYFIKSTDFEKPDVSAFWFTTPFYRISLIQEKGSLKIRDYRQYDENFTFNDITAADRRTALKRIFPACIDSLLGFNTYDVATNLETIRVDRNEEGLKVETVSKDKEKREVSLEEEKLIINGQEIFNSRKKLGLINNLKDLFREYLFNRLLQSNHQFFGGIRFSRIENQYYLGLMVSPTKLWGVRTKYPYLGSFSFPFQTLVRFKTLPEINFHGLFYKSFREDYNQCKIKI